VALDPSDRPGKLDAAVSKASSRTVESRQETLLNILSGKDRSLKAELMRAGLSILTPLYALVISVYRMMYDAGWLREVRLPVPVISIGNLTVGGTGKTGLALMLAKLLQKKGIRPALLNYGYRARLGKGPAVVSDGEHVLLDAEEAGDEAVLLGKSLPGVPVLIGKRRVESGALALQRFSPDALILDDGFQYWRLARDLNLVLINAAEPWGYNGLLPRGLLREHPAALKRASAVILTHSLRVTAERLQSLKADIERLIPRIPLFEANYAPSHLRPLGSEDQTGLNLIKQSRIGVLTALGSPADFEQSIERLMPKEIVPYRYPDHHLYRREDIRQTLQDATERGLDFLITTAKDAVKLESLNLEEPILSLYVMEAELQVQPAEAFERWVLDQLATIQHRARKP
jgi:tetraacyldisaccharide 4'-kinase